MVMWLSREALISDLERIMKMDNPPKQCKSTGNTTEQHWKN